MDVSIIVPIYNVKEYIRPALDSVLSNIQQCDVEAEVLLVDDGSTDGSSTIAREFAEMHGAFRYLYQQNKGTSVARNNGVANSTGDYVMFFDPDDILVEGTLASMFKVAKSSKAEVTVCDVALIDYTGRISGSPLHIAAFDCLPSNRTNIHSHSNLIYDATPVNKLIDRNFYNQAGISFPVGYRVEDYPAMVRLYLQAKTVAVLRRTGYLWRKRGGNNPSVSQRHTERKNLTDRIAMIRMVFDELDEFAAEDEIRRAVETKTLTMDFNGYLSKLKEMNRSEAEEYLRLMAELIRERIRPSTMNIMPLRVQQRINDILACDIDHLIRVENCLRDSYNNAVVRRDGNELFIELPSFIFTIQSRKYNPDAALATPLTYIDKIQIEGSCIKIEGHLYNPRVTISTVKEQQVKAYLINEFLDTKVDLECSSSRCQLLTKTKGQIISHEDYRFHEYCYDGTGFLITINFDRLDDIDGLDGDNWLILEYDNFVKHGFRIQRGIALSARKVGESFRYGGTRYSATLVWDARGSFKIRMKNVLRD